MNNDIKEPTPMGIKIAIPLKYWYWVGTSRWENLLYTRVTIWVNTILNHIDTTAILYLEMKALAWYVDPNEIENKSTIEYPYPTDIQKNVK